MLNLNFLLILGICHISGAFSTHFTKNFPKCMPDDQACIIRIFNQLFQNDYLGILPPLNPYKPGGALGTLKLRTQDSGLGATIDGHASRISIYGLQDMEFQQIKGFGPDCENTNIKMIVTAPAHTFQTDFFTAKIKLLALPEITANFVMNATAASTIAIVNMENDVVHRNGKTHMVVKTVKIKLEFERLSLHLYSKELSPFITTLINKCMNTQWRSYYEEIQDDFEYFTGRVIQSILSSFFDKIAIQDCFRQ